LWNSYQYINRHRTIGKPLSESAFANDKLAISDSPTQEILELDCSNFTNFFQGVDDGGRHRKNPERKRLLERLCRTVNFVKRRYHDGNRGVSLSVLQ
jgi:hypothetical protein